MNQCTVHQIMSMLKSKIGKQRNRYMSDAFDESRKKEM